MGSARALLRDGVVFASGIAVAILLGTAKAPDTARDESMTTPDVAAGRSWGQHTPKTEARAQQAHAGVSDAARVAKSAQVDAAARVSGGVEIGENVFVAPLASVRGDEGQPIHLGAQSNVQDGAVIHGLATEPGYEVEGRTWSVYVGERVSIAPQAQVHAPAWIEDGVFVGMQALVWKARVGQGCVIEPGAKVIGVNVPPGRYVPAGAVITTQSAADGLPEITFSYGLKDLNDGVVGAHTNRPHGDSEAEAPAAAASE
jgi:carbonic anhydrase/acetyltransferase-like protein (isoleucine patch superfamily)